MMNISKNEELFRACTVLFGPDVDVSLDFLYYIQPAGVKSAYRKKALLTHPDRQVHMEEDAEQSQNASNEFIAAREAYESLSEFIRLRDNTARRPHASPMRPVYTPPRRTPRKRRARQYSESSTGRPAGNYYTGPLPGRVLLFGEYLFYSGTIPWEALIKGIVWQRTQRPRLGDIARHWGWISERQAHSLIRRRKLGEQYGEALVRHQHISRKQLAVLLDTQRRMQKPFGEFFVANGYITRTDLHKLLAAFKLHNYKLTKAPSA